MAGIVGKRNLLAAGFAVGTSSGSGHVPLSNLVHSRLVCLENRNWCRDASIFYRARMLQLPICAALAIADSLLVFPTG